MRMSLETSMAKSLTMVMSVRKKSRHPSGTLMRERKCHVDVASQQTKLPVSEPESPTGSGLCPYCFARFACPGRTGRADRS